VGETEERNPVSVRFLVQVAVQEARIPGQQNNVGIVYILNDFKIKPSPQNLSVNLAPLTHKKTLSN
jgi:hypothetical protein